MPTVGTCDGCKWYEAGIHDEPHYMYVTWKTKIMDPTEDSVDVMDTVEGWCHGSTPPWRGTNAGGYCRLYEKK